MKPERSLLSRLIRYFLVGMFLLCVVFPTCVATYEKLIIDNAVRNASSIEIVHYNPYSHMRFGEQEIVYGTINLKKEDFHKVSDAFPYSLDLGCPLIQTLCSFDPHHRIVITDATGQQKVIQVCFICHHIEVGADGAIIPTPVFWMSSLRRFFEEEGLPYQPEKYR